MLAGSSKIDMRSLIDFSSSNLASPVKYQAEFDDRLRRRFTTCEDLEEDEENDGV